MADAKISALTSYTTPLNADLVPIVDTANTATKQVSWANIKATLKTYFDTLYVVTSIVGITGTKAQFDTAVSDGNIMFDGDSITNATATAHRVFYSDGSGVITELALGADGTFLKSNGAAVAPSFATPAGSGDVSKVGTPANNQVGVWTGDGTLEGDAALTFDTATDTLTTGIVNSTSLTASQLTATDASKNIVSLPVATYPSLTETTYVKGVTSAIQTQLDAKLPLAGGTLTGNITLGENTGIALDPAGSADGKWSGITIAGTAGYTQAFGDLVYLAAADSRWEMTDADASATGGPVMIGMVVSAGTDGTACTILLQGQIRADAKFPALTVGAPVYVGETAGAIQTAIPTGADNVIRVVGFALTADEIYFNPSQDHQISVA